MTGLSNCRCDTGSKQVTNKTFHAAARLTQSRACVARGTTTLIRRPARSEHFRSRTAVVEVVSFKFMKKLGLKKPEFLPDFGKVRLKLTTLLEGKDCLRIV